MSNVIELFPDRFPQHDAISALRRLADMMESGQFDCSSVTVCNGVCVWHFGEVDDYLATIKAHWNLSFGAARMMKAAIITFELDEDAPE